MAVLPPARTVYWGMENAKFRRFREKLKEKENANAL